MNKLHRLLETLYRTLPHGLLLLPFFCVPCRVAQAQTAAEYAGSTSVSGGMASEAKPPGWTAIPSKDQGASPHLAASSGPPTDVANRQVLEQHAGKDASKLLLRSTPSGARVWIDGALVGTTPMLLVLAPGKYKLEMRGQRLDFAERAVDLLPRETREVALPLAVRYPTRVSLR